MGDGFSDARRDERRALEHQAQIDKFFYIVADFLDENQKRLKKRDVVSAFVEYDTFLYKRSIYLAMKRQEKRKRAFSRRLSAVLKNDAQAWAELLTEAIMEASKDCFERVLSTSLFADEPVVVLVPRGEHREPCLLGDWRGFHYSVEQDAMPQAFTVQMEERTVKGMRQTDDGWEEICEPGWDDVRFMSFC